MILLDYFQFHKSPISRAPFPSTSIMPKEATAQNTQRIPHPSSPNPHPKSDHRHCYQHPSNVAPPRIHILHSNALVRSTDNITFPQKRNKATVAPRTPVNRARVREVSLFFLAQHCRCFHRSNKLPYLPTLETIMCA